MKLPFPYSVVIACVAMQISVGCGHVRYPTNYVLDFPPAAAPVRPLPEPHGALAIHEFRCPQYLCEGRIIYRPTPEEIGFYEFHRWAMNPREMITQFIAGRIQSEQLFQSVALQRDGVEPAYVLEGNIERLEEVDQGRDVRAVCTISAQLIDTKAKSIIWSHTASEAVVVENRNVAGVVSSLSLAARMTVDSLVKSLGETVPSAGRQ